MKTKKKKAKISDVTRLRSAVRKVWSWSSVRRDTLTAARLRLGVYRCAICKRETPTQEIKVDHIVPFAPIQGLNNLADWGAALVRMFDPNNHQAVCEVPCHKTKTATENSARRIYKRSGKS